MGKHTGVEGTAVGEGSQGRQQGEEHGSKHQPVTEEPASLR